MKQFPQALRHYLVIISVAGTGALAWTLAQWSVPSLFTPAPLAVLSGAGHVWALTVALAVPLLFTRLYPLSLAPGLKINADTMPFFLLVMLVPPAISLPVAAACVVLAGSLRRSPPHDILFNTARAMLLVMAMVASYMLVVRHPLVSLWSPGTRRWPGIVTAAITVHVADYLMVLTAVALQRGHSVWRIWGACWRMGLGEQTVLLALAGAFIVFVAVDSRHGFALLVVSTSALVPVSWLLQRRHRGRQTAAGLQPGRTSEATSP